MNPKFASFLFCSPLLFSLHLYALLLLILLLPTPCLYVGLPTANLNPSKVTLMEGENLALSCTSSGVPSPELIWKMALVTAYVVRSHTHTETHTETQTEICLEYFILNYM